MITTWRARRCPPASLCLCVETKSVFSITLSTRGFTKLRSGAGRIALFLRCLGKNLLQSSSGRLAESIHSCGRSPETPVFWLPVSIRRRWASGGGPLLPRPGQREGAPLSGCAFFDHWRKSSLIAWAPAIRVKSLRSLGPHSVTQLREWYLPTLALGSRAGPLSRGT